MHSIAVIRVNLLLNKGEICRVTIFYHLITTACLDEISLDQTSRVSLQFENIKGTHNDTVSKKLR